MEACDVLIVGAGPAGLASAACLAQRNIPYTLIEAGPHVGARWRTHYDRLSLHTTNRGSASVSLIGYRNALTGLLRQIGVEAELVARAIANPGNSQAPAASSRHRCS